MEPELQKYYNELFTTFGTPGWGHFIERVQQLYDQTEKARPTGNDAAARAGILESFEYILEFQKQHEDAYEQMNEATD